MAAVPVIFQGILFFSDLGVGGGPMPGGPPPGIWRAARSEIFAPDHLLGAAIATTQPENMVVPFLGSGFERDETPEALPGDIFEVSMVIGHHSLPKGLCGKWRSNVDSARPSRTLTQFQPCQQGMLAIA